MTSDTAKEVFFVRHAQSTYNVISKDGPPGGNFAEELLDAPLSELGHEQVKALRKTLRDGGFHDVDVVVASPLTRALQTAHAFDLDAIKLVVDPMCREWTMDSCDIGSAPPSLAQAFPHLSNALEAAALPPHWWCPPACAPESASPAAALAWMSAGGTETRDELESRAKAFLARLVQRPERRLAVVSHSDFIHTAVGVSLPNCGIARFTHDGKEWKEVKDDE